MKTILTRTQHAVTNRARQGRRGVAALEFAVLMPLLALLFVVAVDFARIFYYSQILWNCARQGAMQGALFSTSRTGLQPPYPNISSAALADASNLSPAPTVTSTTGTDAAGNPYVSVTVTWTFSTITDYPGVGNTFQLTRTAQIRIPPQLPQ